MFKTTVKPTPGKISFYRIHVIVFNEGKDNNNFEKPK